MKTIKIYYYYFSATLTGYNGSRGREIAKAEWCWDSEEQAMAALDAECQKKREAWCDAFGVDCDDEIVSDRFRGWLGDYQRTQVSFIVVPNVCGVLMHSLMRVTFPGEIPKWNQAELAVALNVSEADICASDCIVTGL